ncbi:HD domain-containing protein [Puniceicoccaceae bacterium K14]|nr:HD domain-containing protein [Puniceicoccaceae bacterium K14]
MTELSPRLMRQMDFIIEADKLKNVFRRSFISDQSRRENDAEHSWHLCLMTIILAEYANEPDLNVLKILKMVIIHDIVEIDAGDTYIYDEAAKQSQAQREQKAADRLFSILPEDQAHEYRQIWDEFEAAQSKEAAFAKSIDRLHPMLLNYLAKGKTWKEHGVAESDIRRINGSIQHGSEDLWGYAEHLIKKSVNEGLL